MDQRPKVLLENAAKPSKLLALLALVLAFSLPFILVKSFSHKQKTINMRQNNSFSTPEELSTAILATIWPAMDKNLIIPLSIAAMETSIPEKAAMMLAQQVNFEKLTAIRDITLAARRASVELPAKENTLRPAVKAAAKIASSPVAPAPSWKIIKTRPGDSLAALFNQLGLKSQTLQALIKETPLLRSFSKLKPNQQFQFLLSKQHLEKMILPLSPTQNVVVYREGLRYKSKIETLKMTTQNRYLTATIKGSLYSTSKRNNIPYKLIQQMTDIFSSDINFAKDLRSGDQFSIIYKAFYVKDKEVGVGDIVAVTYKNRGKNYQALRFTSKNGQADYYTPQGDSLKKAFSRYPLRFSHISSTFSLARNHPILRYKRPHKGIDLAAPIGTPIAATGDGHIEIIGRQSGYGNMIKINHNKMYSTIYGHMLKFQKGLSRGTYVKRGQIIGYVGQTGLATGPHCHYEFHIHKQPKNPTTVDLPRGAAVPQAQLAAFKANASTLLAQLKLYQETRLAKR